MNKRDEIAEAHGNRLFQSGETYLDSKCGYESYRAGWDAREEQIKAKACPDCWEQMKPYPTTDDTFVCETCGSKWRKAALVTVCALKGEGG